MVSLKIPTKDYLHTTLNVVPALLNTNLTLKLFFLKNIKIWPRLVAVKYSLKNDGEEKKKY
ncbi:MAG: hypothetical protein AAB821_01090 [Patescibacteria group bacterium]